MANQYYCASYTFLSVFLNIKTAVYRLLSVFYPCIVLLLSLFIS